MLSLVVHYFTIIYIIFIKEKLEESIKKLLTHQLTLENSYSKKENLNIKYNILILHNYFIILEFSIFKRDI